MKISDHCYAIQGLYFVSPWSVNAGFIAGNEKTLIVDTSCNSMTAETIYGYAKAVKPNNDIIVVNTEKHLDHIGGNGFFRAKGIDIYGHELIKRDSNDLSSMVSYFGSYIDNRKRKDACEEQIMFENSEIVNPNIIVSKDVEIDLGGLMVKVLMTPGHTETNISVYVPSDKVLYSGDTIVTRFIPNLEEGSAKEWDHWLKSLELLNNLDVEAVVPGHGKCLLDKEAIKNEFERLNTIINYAVHVGKAPTL